MKAQVIFTEDGYTVEHIVDLENLVVFMTIRGHRFTKFNNDQRQRVELRNQPKFEGMIGPAYHSAEMIRYEDTDAYARFSQ